MIEDVARYGASRDVTRRVVSRLDQRGLDAQVDATRSFVTVTGTVDDIARVFDTKFGLYKTQDGATYVSNEKRAVVPAAIDDDVVELTGFVSTVQAGESSGPAPAGEGNASGGTATGCAGATGTGAFMPGQIMDAYGISSLQADGYSGQGRSVALLETSRYDQQAIDGFAECFGLPTIEPEVHVIAGHERALVERGLEVAVDVEMLLAAAPELSRLDIFQIDPYLGPAFGLAEMFDPATTGGRVVDVFATSVAYCEQFLSEDDVLVAEHLLAAGAAMGISAVAAAGDHGAAGCYPADRAEAVQYPASSQFATAVGGTSILLNDANEITEERAWNNSDTGGDEWAGGGGTSEHIDTPSYQDHLGHDRRVVPDVALFGDPHQGVAVYYCSSATDCGWGAVGGTSAAVPIAGGGLALIDQREQSTNQPSIGFANPLLYDLAGKGSALIDITRGNTALFGLSCCRAGEGYDMATGLGRLDFGELASAIPDAAR